MRRLILAAACGLLLAGQAEAGVLHRGTPALSDAPILAAQQDRRAFARCMRQRYGPHHYRGVKRAHRYFMAQACGG